MTNSAARTEAKPPEALPPSAPTPDDARSAVQVLARYVPHRVQGTPLEHDEAARALVVLNRFASLRSAPASSAPAGAIRSGEDGHE